MMRVISGQRGGASLVYFLAGKAGRSKGGKCKSKTAAPFYVSPDCSYHALGANQVVLGYQGRAEVLSRGDDKSIRGIRMNGESLRGKGNLDC